MAIGLSWPIITFCHLIIHAFFKAIIFVATGNLIHFSNNYQSLKITGGIYYSSRVMTAAIIIRSLGLCGAPFAAAFFSKEPIIEISILNESRSFLLFLILARVILTCVYRIRFVSIVLISLSNLRTVYNLYEEYFLPNKSILLLFILAFFGGRFINNRISFFPVVFYYPLIFKILIFSILAMRFITFLNFNFFFFKKMEFFIFRIWNINIFSSSLFNMKFLLLSKFIIFSHSYFVVKVMLNSIKSYGVFNILNKESNFLYRIIFIIPLIIIILFYY